MCSPINLLELIPRVHEAAKANGWWGTPRNPGEALMLVVSELAEALEADRSGRKYTEGAAMLATLLADSRRPHSSFQTCFREWVKDTVADELADAYIRLCDFAGGFGYGAQAVTEETIIMRRNPFALRENFGENLLYISRFVIELSAKPELGRYRYQMGTALAAIEALCAREGIDLATHIDLKLAYNATRGIRHGNKAY